MSIPLYLQLGDTVVDSVQPEAVIEVVHGPVEALELWILLEKQFGLGGHV